MLTILIIICIIAAVAIGYIWRINIGLLSLAFAYLIGVFAMDLSPVEVMNLWPLQIFFVIFSVSFFYAFASSNGTLSVLAARLLSRFDKRPFLLPFALFFCSALVAAMGAGFYSVMAFMAPLAFAICARTGLSKLTASIAINYGALGGANLPTSQSGVIFRALMQQAQTSAQQAFANSWMIFAATMLLPLVVISLLIWQEFMLKKRKKLSAQTAAANSQENLPLKALAPPGGQSAVTGKKTSSAQNSAENAAQTAAQNAAQTAAAAQDSFVTNPAAIAFSSKQKLTLFLMAAMMLIVLAFPLLNIIFPRSDLIAAINSRLEISFVALLFALLALWLKLGSESRTLALVPWSTLLLICGVGALVAIAVRAGVSEQLAAFIHEHVPPIAVPLALMCTAAVMGLFSSTMGVVTPALFPLVPSLAQAAECNAAGLFACIVAASQASAISPFSSGGAMLLGACANDEKDALSRDLLAKGVPLALVAVFAIGPILAMF